MPSVKLQTLLLSFTLSFDSEIYYLLNIALTISEASPATTPASDPGPLTIHYPHAGQHGKVEIATRLAVIEVETLRQIVMSR